MARSTVSNNCELTLYMNIYDPCNDPVTSDILFGTLVHDAIGHLGCAVRCHSMAHVQHFCWAFIRRSWPTGFIMPAPHWKRRCCHTLKSLILRPIRKFAERTTQDMTNYRHSLLINSKEADKIQKLISPDKRVCVTLRFLATGETATQLYQGPEIP